MILPNFNEQLQPMNEYNPPLSGRRAYSGVLLDFNELVGPPSQAVCEAMKAALVGPQVYPEYDGLLEERIAFYANVDVDNVLVTNGSDQAIQIIGRSVLNPERTAIVPQPSFAMLRLVAEETGANIIEPFYDAETKSYPTDEVLGAIDGKTGLITVCSPNNPTGTLTSLEDIESIAKAAPQAIVLVDEAYYDFAKQTAAGLIEENLNIVVTRTFSKAFGIPALRMGYMIGDKEVVAQVAKLRGPYDINQIGYSAATAALSDEGMTETTAYIDEINNRSRPVLGQYLDTAGINYWPSAANFILMEARRRTGKLDVAGVVDDLDKAGFRVRKQDKPGIEGTIRVSLGNLATTRSFIKALDEIL